MIFKNILLLGFIASMLIGCNKDDNNDDIFQFERSVRFTISAGLIGGPITHNNENSFQTNLEDIFTANDFSISEVTGIFPRRGIIRTLGQGNLDFIEELSIEMFDENRKSEIYYHPLVDRNTGNFIDIIENNQVNVINYFMNETYNIRLKTQHRSITSTTLAVEILMTYGVQ